ncbi:SDR family NAD(P)-dependent oxidoreductase [Streptomyces sp. NPDC002755]|uniref:SDR family NAD(P)-dependent oxidoreductase n=1 Tax=Streptomyces sp. NPDC002884 TaxID=3154544 RepID=UPI00332E7AA2
MSPHALVTGAASGIGAAIADDLAAHGWRITGVDLRADALRVALDAIHDRHAVPVRAVTGDLADADFAAALVDEAWSEAPVDGLVNAAGIYPAIPFEELTPHLWDRVQHVNVRAAVLTAQRLAHHARPAGRTPAVVNIASGAALRGRPGAAHYATSKAALVMATKATAVELGPHGIRVNAVSPGFVDVDSPVNPVTPGYADAVGRSLLPGRAEAAHIAPAVRFLLGAEAAWITGANLPVDGGGSAGTTALPHHWPEPTPWQLGSTEATA